MLSKDTHWLMGAGFAQKGFAVFNVNYRLAPEHPFPAALEDVCEAYLWVVENASRFGADPETLVVAGESAGANLATNLVIANTFDRPEPFMRAVFESPVVPTAAIAACGMLQVTDIDRFMRRRPIPTWLADRIREASEPYLRGVDFDSPTIDLADPLLILEGDRPHRRELPPFFAFAGTRDPILDDTRRLQRAITDRGSACTARYYPGEVHAFHAFVWRRHAQECWRDQFDFLAQTTTRR